MERIEFVVRELYGRARLDMSEPCGAVRLATELLGARCVRIVSARAIPGNAALAWNSRAPVMFVRGGLAPRQVNYAVAHELAEWKLRLLNYVSADAEELANRIAVALCVPRLAFERARMHLGDSVRRLSRCFGICQPLMALRMAECLAAPTAVSVPAMRIAQAGANQNASASAELLIGGSALLESSQAGAQACLVTVTDGGDREVHRAAAMLCTACVHRSRL